MKIALPLPVLLFGQTEIHLALLVGLTAVAVASALRTRARGPVMWYSLLLVGWVAMVGNTFDVRENYRFRYLVDPIRVALAAALARRA